METIGGCHNAAVAAGDSGIGASVPGRLESFALRSTALGLGSAGLLLDFTGWYTIAGGVLGLIGFTFALFSPRGKLRSAARSLNAVTFVVAVVILAAFFL